MENAKLRKVLLIVALCSFLCVPTSARSAEPAWAKWPPAASLLRSKTAEAEQANSESDGAGSLFINEPNLATRAADGLGSQELFFKMMLSIVFVVALGAVAIYVSKKLLPRITNLPGKEIRVLETAYLGPRKAVHLVEIANRRLLIGSTNESITTLADVTGEMV